ncbi:MAG: winged helix-turn-helix domain-containing protein, partial [Gammaproteobacteria bacterium]|nr:winged helix-turn-helix domain-containing protein [Gammaproteobacteria bacterium]
MEARNSEGGERPTVYRFGEFVLDVGRSALLNGNRLVPLRPKSYEVLKALLERPARLVSKRELLDIVWRNQVVSEDSLVHCITDIRRALNDQDRRLVRTVARRGYVLEAGVTRMDEVPAALALTHRRSPPHRDLWFRLAAALAVLAVGLMVPAVNDAIDEPDAADTRPAAAPSARLDYEFAEFLYQRR